MINSNQQVVGVEQYPEKSFSHPLPTAPDIPEWLLPSDPTPSTTPAPPTPPAPPIPPSKDIHKELLLTQYESFFMRVLDLIPKGYSLSAVLKEDLREFEYNSFMQWLRKDPVRVARYKDAKELRAEHWAGEIIEIADASDALEDVNRSKLRIDSRKWLMGADFRKQYGDVKQIELGGSISVISALEAANNRLVELADVVDVTDKLQLEAD